MYKREKLKRVDDRERGGDKMMKERGVMTK
jgi:hypothetical protein